MLLHLCCIYFTILIICTNTEDPDVGRDMSAMAISKGYTSIEKHFVTTEDGYILGVFRIPRGRNMSDTKAGKPVVFLQHGLLDSSWTWINNFPGESLGFILADSGFDVWFGNSRGNTYSKGHTRYPVNSNEFWDFTWDDMAKYDLPAVFSYILDNTGQRSLSYVGHSQGTIQALAAFSMNHTIASKVSIAVLLAPVAFAHHASGLLPVLANLNLDALFLLFGVREFLPDATILQKLAPDICKWVPWGCEDFLFLIVGGSDNLNQTRIPVYISETPAGTSVKNMAHWSQSVRAEVFQMYDYGSAASNKAHYGQPTPPKYDLTQFNIPCALYYGGNDILADPTDVATILGQIPTQYVVQSLFQRTFAHLDYTWGFNKDTQNVYADVVAQLRKYNK